MQKDYNELHNQKCDSQSESFSKMVIEEADIVKPIIKEQLFREYILGTGDTLEIFKIYCKTFQTAEDLKTRMLIIKPSGEHEDLFFFRNAAEQSIGAEHIVAGISVNEYILITTNITDKPLIVSEIEKLRRRIKNCYNNDLTVIYSDVTRFDELPLAFEKLAGCLDYAFYASDNRTLFAGDVKMNREPFAIDAQYANIEKAVRGGDIKSVSELVNGFFAELERSMPVPAVAKTYCLELYVCIIRCCEAEQIDQYMKGLVSIQHSKGMREIREFIAERAEEITKSNAPHHAKRHSALVAETIVVIENNISNENLSLRWLAGTILYTNVDYLGKLFKKEMGKNFSHYVMEKRMEMAKSLIADGKKDRIYEVAEKVGYGSNPQYFSQVFKKYTGISPLEYKEKARHDRKKDGDGLLVKTG